MGQQINVGDRVSVVIAPGVPGTAYAGISGTVVSRTGDLVRLAYFSQDNRRAECVVVQRRLVLADASA